MPTPSSPPQPTDLTDEQVRSLLVAHAATAAAQMADPTAPEAQQYLARVVAADPAAVRKHLAG